MIKYSSVVLLCSDMNRSRSFYQDLFTLEIELDIGALVTFKGGISLWDATLAKTLLYSGSDPSHPQTCPTSELYFETDDIEGFFQRITQTSVPLLHPIETTPWQQQTVRFFDPDGHLIEVGESMIHVIKRIAKTGLSDKEISEKTYLPEEYIRAVCSGSIVFPDAT